MGKNEKNVGRKRKTEIMKVALVHDYIGEFGGAERVLRVLSDMFPDAPIYTAYYKKDSRAYKYFKDKKIIESWAAVIPYFPELASPLRFLLPWIWGSLDLSKYDLVISSASGYVAKGFNKKDGKPFEICYCHTPPRWLYGYKTAREWPRSPLIRAYAKIVGDFIRKYDFEAAQRVNYFIANSHEVAGRIKKFYGRDSKVIYPPVSLPITDKKFKKGNYYFILSRISGAKGIEMAFDAAAKGGFELVIAGEAAGYYKGQKKMIEKQLPNVKFFGFVPEEDVVRMYSEAKGFLALAEHEDFGITPVESMLCGTAVIAYNGGGYKETVVDGKTGVLFDDYSVDGLLGAIKKFENSTFDVSEVKKHAQKFNKERFEKEIRDFIREVIK